MKKKSRGWYVYIVQASDKTLYTGIARNVQKRLNVHTSGKGSRYLRGRSPLKIVYRQALAGRSEALKREVQIKKLTRAKKQELIGASHTS